jgi:alpha-ketoglutarate-dependent taurine dioxygenase
MIDISPVDFISIQEIKDNPEKYKEIYFRDKILVFRNANLNEEQQSELMIFFGDLLGWYPNSKNPTILNYKEDHHRQMVNGIDIPKDQLMLSWHVEHVENEEDPHCGATWRMEKFECDEDSGHTYFVDMTNMYNLLQKDEQEFLSNCEIRVETTVRRDENEEAKEFEIIRNFNCISLHPVTGEKTVRLSLFSQHGLLNSLHKFDGRDPSKEENDKFVKIYNWIISQVWYNEDIRMVLKWKQGDLAVPDLYKLAHSVSGGFTKNQRTLRGQFGKLKPWRGERDAY